MAAITLDRRQSHLSCSHTLKASSLAPTHPEPAPVLPSQGAEHTLPNAIAFSPALNTFGTGSPMPLPPGPALPGAPASRGGKDSAPALLTPRPSHSRNHAPSRYTSGRASSTTLPDEVQGPPTLRSAAHSKKQGQLTHSHNLSATGGGGGTARGAAPALLNSYPPAGSPASPQPDSTLLCCTWLCRTSSPILMTLGSALPNASDG